jgi:hypothetical protein
LKSASKMCITRSLSILGLPCIFSSIRLTMVSHHSNTNPYFRAMLAREASISKICSDMLYLTLPSLYLTDPGLT